MKSREEAVSIPSVEEIDVEDKRVLVRLDLDLPLGPDGKVRDWSGLERALPTLRHIRSRKARLVLCSHLGTLGGGGRRRRPSLIEVGGKLAELLGTEVIFPRSPVGDAVRKLSMDLQAGGVMLLENLLFHPGEERNDPAFAERLARLAELYVNEAFTVAHLELASTCAVVRFFDVAAVGMGFASELRALERITRAPARPFVAVMGGGGVKEKLEILDNLKADLDAILVGGAVANTFLKAVGKHVGASELDESALYGAARIVSSASARGVRVVLPKEVVCVPPQGAQPATEHVVQMGRVPQGWRIVDVGPAAAEDYAEIIGAAATVLWMGVMGTGAGYERGTARVAEAVAGAEAYTVVAGAEAVEFVERAGLSGTITHLSLGGKAAVEFLKGNALPAVDALREKSR